MSLSSWSSAGAGSDESGASGTRGSLQTSMSQAVASQPVSGKKRSATRRPALPWSLKKSVNALVLLVHLLLSSIDPDLSNMMNMLMGTRLASSPVAAQVLPLLIDAPLLAMGLN